MEINQLHLKKQYFHSLNRTERNVPQVVHISEEEKEQWRRKWLSSSGWRARVCSDGAVRQKDKRLNMLKACSHVATKAISEQIMPTPEMTHCTALMYHNDGKEL